MTDDGATEPDISDVTHDDGSAEVPHGDVVDDGSAAEGDAFEHETAADGAPTQDAPEATTPRPDSAECRAHTPDDAPSSQPQTHPDEDTAELHAEAENTEDQTAAEEWSDIGSNILTLDRIHHPGGPDPPLAA